jgi:DNA-binding SARP family transcriptional activator
MADSGAEASGPVNAGPGNRFTAKAPSTGSAYPAPGIALPRGGRAVRGAGEKRPEAIEKQWPILVCLLGEFRVLKGDRPLALRGDKTEALLQLLALHGGQHVARETLLDTLWPDRSVAMAGQCLNSLIYSLRKAVGDAIHEGALILHQNGAYRLNASAGVGIDVTVFDNLVQRGHQATVAGDRDAAIACYVRAIRLYRGDLRPGTDVNSAIERERLRASFLTILAHMADYSFASEDYLLAAHYAQRILEYDACREDAHRLVMRCFVRQGQRTQALRQFRLCESVLRAEFDVGPEPQTCQLHEQIRLDPATV